MNKDKSTLAKGKVHSKKVQGKDIVKKNPAKTKTGKVELNDSLFSNEPVINPNKVTR